MANFLTKIFSKGGANTAQPKTAIKAPKGQASVQGFLRTVTAMQAWLPRSDLNVANLDITEATRNAPTTPGVIRRLIRMSPDLSAAASALIRTGIPEKYKIIARNDDGSFNLEGTRLAMSMANRMNTSPDYMNGFTQISTLRSVSEALAKEELTEGAMMMELVLDDNRLPFKFQPIPVSQIKWFPADVENIPVNATPPFTPNAAVNKTQPKQVPTSIRPVQRIAGVDIDLDLPTIFYTALDADLTDAYAQSPFEAAVQPVLAGTTFLNDLRRVCSRHVYPRYDLSIDEEKLRARIPPDILMDQDKLNNYLNGVISNIENTINGMGVEEALIHFDFFDVKFVEGGSGDVPDTFGAVQDIINAKIATGSKVMPSILGHGSGSQNVASTETMLFMIAANGMIRIKLQEIFSKAFTLAIRLFGIDASVKFEYDTIDLRPESELTTFRVMQQSKILEQLSYGFITDEEACIELTGNLPPPGFVKLSGTLFFAASGANWAPAAANPLGNQQGALGQNLQPDTPQAPKGPAKKATLGVIK